MFSISQGKVYTNARHTPIISKELWDKAQEALASPHSPYRAKKDFAYRGLLVCGKCDCTVVGQNSKKKYIYYRCSFSKGTHKHAGYIREEKMSELFLPIIQTLSIPEKLTDYLEKAIRDIAEKREYIKLNKKEILQKDYDKARRKLNNLYDLQLEDKMNKEMFYIKEKELTDEITRLKGEIINCDTDAGAVCEKARKTLELTNNLELRYKQANNSDKARILKLLGTSYVLDNQNAIRPTYRTPFNYLADIKSAFEADFVRGNSKSYAFNTDIAFTSCNKTQIRSV